MNVGMRIKQLRQERGWSQSELGEKLGVKKAAVQKWESGHVQNLKNSTIRQLCELFRKSPSFFIFDDHELMCDERISDGLGLLEAIQRTYGDDVISLLEMFVSLDDEHRSYVLSYASHISIVQSVRSVSVDTE